ncbi:MAG: LLM class flavin-dependent oxidoreductase [Methanobacteriota archaeon]|nr:MAG: LLM class flavin-dependent oxidoreductase [Euryarchaeota archaeon]
MITLSLGITTSMTVEESKTLVGAAEDAGYTRVWLGEDIFHREVFTYLSLLAAGGSSIGLGVGVTSPYVRYKEVLAASAKAVSELSQGRFILGLGAGGLPEVERLTGSRPRKPVSVMEEAIKDLRERTGLSIYVGARGPRMLELAGRVADGVILSGPKRYLDRALEIVDEASEGRRVRKVLWNAFYLGENEALLSKVTEVMLQSMPPFAKDFMDRRDPERDLCVAGPPERVAREIRGFEKKGFDEVVIGPPYGETPESAIAEMGEIIGDRHKH